MEALGHRKKIITEQVRRLMYRACTNLSVSVRVFVRGLLFCLRFDSLFLCVVACLCCCFVVLLCLSQLDE